MTIITYFDHKYMLSSKFQEENIEEIENEH
jgi:hypothetical protein